ncbi:MAG: hypothetical protein HOP16_00690 [Acidobacteria bacterium]|nr:hypothetical protein [Acidobacteriota bacterium]
MSCIRAVCFGLSAMVLGLGLTASPALAQDPPVVVVTGGLDVVNQYNFRGIRQNSEGVSIWPYVDFGFTPFRGEGGLKTATLNVGSWNAINSQINEDDFGTGNKWYESDFYATLGFGFSKASLGFTYTSYTSPADLFAHVKELAVKVGVDDSAALGKGALKPYALVAFELTDDGQADAGAAKGTYLELGVAPGYAGSKASLAVPIKVGLSASDYYEFGGDDEKFGYFSIAGIVTVPLGAHANIHGGVEFQTFGDSVKVYNDQDSVGIASIGLGFSF